MPWFMPGGGRSAGDRPQTQGPGQDEEPQEDRQGEDQAQGQKGCVLPGAAPEQPPQGQPQQGQGPAQAEEGEQHPRPPEDQGSALQPEGIQQQDDQNRRNVYPG